MRDPLDNIWCIRARVEELDAEEMVHRAGDPDAPAAMTYMQRVLDEAMMG